jgi:hypothetical protein
MKKTLLTVALVGLLVASAARADKKATTQGRAWSKQADGYHFKTGNRDFILIPAQVHIQASYAGDRNRRLQGQGLPRKQTGTAGPSAYSYVS